MAITFSNGWVAQQTAAGTGAFNSHWESIGPSATPSYYQLWYNTTSSNASATILANNITGTSYNSNPAWTNGQTYYFWLKAVDSTGTAGSFSLSRSLTWDITPPSVPSISVPPTNSPNTSRAVTISWSTSTDSLSGMNASAPYVLTRNGTQVYAGTATSYTDTPAADGTYTYAVYAVDVKGNKSGSTSGNCTITLLAPPGTVATPAVGKASANSITVSWSVPTGSTPAGYYVYRNGVNYTTDTASPFTDTNLADGTYYYQIMAYNAAGNGPLSAASAAIAIDTTPPAVPSITSAYQQSTTARAVSITWTGPADATSYRLERNGAIVMTTATGGTTVTVTDTPAADGQYTYRVYAGDANGNWSAASAGAVVNVSLLPIPGVPAAPTLVQPNGVTRAVTVSWPAASSAGTYTVYRGTTAAAMTQQLTTTDLSYTDTPPADGTYFYAVQSGNATGSSNVGAAASTTIDRVRTGMAGL